MMAAIKFTRTDDPQGVYCTENHLLIKWLDGDVVGSMTRIGNAMDVHFSAKKESIKDLQRYALLFVSVFSTALLGAI